MGHLGGGNYVFFSVLSGVDFFSVSDPSSAKCARGRPAGSCSKRIVVDVGVCYAPGVCVWKGVTIANFQKRARVQREWSSPSAFAASGRLCPEGRHYREFPILFNAIRRRHLRLCYAQAPAS
jgi:hypothetical protein